MYGEISHVMVFILTTIMLFTVYYEKLVKTINKDTNKFGL